MVSVTVKLFAIYQETVGCPTLEMECPPGRTVQTILDRLIATYPALAPWQSQTRFGLNLEFVSAETPLQPGDEVVLIPPVSGG